MKATKGKIKMQIIIKDDTKAQLEEIAAHIESQGVEVDSEDQVVRMAVRDLHYG